MKKTIYTFWATATIFSMVGACGGDESDPGTASSNDSSTSTTTSTTSATTTGTTSTTGSGGNSTTGTSTTGAVSDCTSTETEGLGVEEAEIPASWGVYSYGDGVTTACLSSEGGNQACLEGLGADAGSDYANWGAGVGVQLAEDDETPWDASADGVVGVKFDIAGTSSDAPVRVGITNTGLTDFPFVADEGGITADGAQTLMFADLDQPSWVGDTSEAYGATFDATKLHSLQFQVVTAQNKTRPYNFCVSNVQWIDGTGAVVELPWHEPSMGAGGEGGGTQ